MAEQLFIRLTRDAHLPEHRFPWALCDAHGKLISSGADPQKALPAARHIAAVIGIDMLLIRAIKLPPGPRARTQAAMAHALEPYMLSEPASNHVTALGITSDGSTVLAAVNRQWLEFCRNTLAQGGKHITCAIAEPSLKSNEADTWVDLWQNNLGVQQQHADAWNWREYVAQLSRRTLAQLPDLSRGLSWPANGSEGVNRSWRFALILLALITAVHAVGTLVQWGMLSSERNALRAKVHTVFRDSVSSLEPLVDPAIQSQRALSAARRAAGSYGDDDFITLLGRLATETTTAQLKTLHYEQGTLTADYQGTTQAALEAIALNLRNNGLRADVTTASSAGVLRLTLRTAP